MLNMLPDGAAKKKLESLSTDVFRATDVNRKSKLLLFGAYNSLFVENIKL